MPALRKSAPRLKLKGELVMKAADATTGVEPRLKIRGELVVKAADATTSMELESANMMVVRVSDSIFNLLLLFFLCQTTCVGIIV
jgi:hypothetical protein